MIAVVERTEKGKSTIILTDAAGSNVRPVTDEEGLSLLPAWDPTGEFLLFTSYLDGNPDLFRLNLATSAREKLSDRKGMNAGACVSPDGQKIAFNLSKDGNSEIYTVDRDGKNLTRLTHDRAQDVSPTWSPNGERIAFTSTRSGEPQIYTMDASGGDVRRLTFQGQANQEPDWSPNEDGQIAYDGRDESRRFDIFLVHPQSGVVTRLTRGPGSNESPTHSPDGRHIAFTSTRGSDVGRRQLFVMDVDGGNSRRVPLRAGDYENPAWGRGPR